MLKIFRFVLTLLTLRVLSDLYPPLKSPSDPRQAYLQEKIKSIGNRHGMNGTQLLKVCNYYPPLSNKDHHLLILKVLFGLDFKDVCLIDDAEDNVQAALNLRCTGVRVPQRQGLKGSDLKLALPSSSVYCAAPDHASSS